MKRLKMLEEEAFLALHAIPYLGPAKLRTLVQLFGSASEALAVSEEQLSLVSGFERILPFWGKRFQESRWKIDLRLAQQHGVLIMPFTHPEFPPQLLKSPEPPALLYVKGAIKAEDQRSIAVVGTRHSSIYGNEMAEQISRALSSQGFTVVSGLARGIDTAAHRGALQGGRTLAVIGSGLANIYPAENRKLAEAITENGAVLSEFPMFTPPERQNFPQRNRIVSGMTLGALLVEAPLKSGAMITMQKAHEYEKKLFALPGRADNENFQGNHALIKSGKAKLVENVEDILVHFETFFFKCCAKYVDRDIHLPDKEESDVLKLMSEEECSIEVLASRSLLPIHKLHSILMGLILKRVVKEFPGKVYKKIIQNQVL